MVIKNYAKVEPTY